MNSRLGFADWFGLARSLLIYYGVPGRARAWQRFYSQLIHAGDLCFDVGAHVGNRSRALLSLGARVVALEPQPFFASALRRMYGHRLTVRQVGVGAIAGSGQMLVSTQNPTISTLSAEWANQIKHTASFATANWDCQAEIEVTTLDALISEFGFPEFCKLDVEGYELEVLRGLSKPIALISFEYLPPVIEKAFACVERLMELGDYRFNIIEGEFPRFALPAWIDRSEMIEYLKHFLKDERAGEVFAKLQ